MQIVVGLRKAGLSYREIAEQTGITKGTISKYLHEALEGYRAITAEETEEMRATWNMRLEGMLTKIMPKVMNQGNLGAVDRVIKIADRIARLNGLDGPVKIAPTTPEGDQLYEPLTESERNERLMAIFDAARARASDDIPQNEGGAGSETS